MVYASYCFSSNRLLLQPKPQHSSLSSPAADTLLICSPSALCNRRRTTFSQVVVEPRPHLRPKFLSSSRLTSIILP
ncbi:hypothetical protein L1987_00836 [Smallanthus sonchifolius]|uniref:Uncharacterized protein n=1 Tax=Smallanthus sonchifolius TaxID=185202 RepID=A0ACB9K3H8_9ASTR|nr:hypothetical protein L1987_00836 [Smallanthus sonchifolius]